MTMRAVLLAWLFALSIAVVVSLLVYNSGRGKLNTVLSANEALFVGTSLTRFALPDHFEPRQLTQIGADNVIRIGISSGTENALFDLTSAAVEAGVGSIFVEVNPVISQFSDAPDSCSWPQKLQYFRKTIRQSANSVLRRRNYLKFANGKPQNTRDRSIDFQRINQLYPPIIKTPCHLERWRDIAMTKGVSQLYLIAMPRDRVAREHIGAQNMADFYAAAADFASEIGVPLFAPDVAGLWGPDHFVDQAHLSVLGSQRFLNNLEAWWADLP